MEIEQVKKIIRLDESSSKNDQKVDVGGGEESSDNEISDMDKLPTEILMEILSYLDERQLVKLRLLSPRWNEICCLVLQVKSKNNLYSRLVVRLRKTRGKNYLQCSTSITSKTLNEFLDCFAPSDAEKSSGRLRPFPFSRFNIQDLFYIKVAQMNRFAPLFFHIKTLDFDTKAHDNKNLEKFWNLLLKFGPNVQHLIITGGHWLNNLKIFDSASNSNVNSNVESQQPESFLQKLKFIQVSTKDGDVDVFMKKLLQNAPNVRELISSDPRYSPYSTKGLNDLIVLKRLGKPHLLKKLEISYYGDSRLNEDPAELMKETRLEYLNAHCTMTENQSTTRGDDLTYHAIKSSQSTLSTLDLSNLTTKSMKFLFGDVSSLPNVRRLKLTIKDVIEITSTLDRFSKLCPNTTSLDIGRFPLSNVSDVGHSLWTGFKGLKSLKFEVDCSNEKDRLWVLDSVLSGYSKESIEKIELRMETGISVDEAREEEPQEPSIFDLKDLSRLQIEYFYHKKRSDVFNLKNHMENGLLLKILPRHIRENSKSFSYRTFDVADSSDSESEVESGSEYDDDYGMNHYGMHRFGMFRRCSCMFCADESDVDGFDSDGSDQESFDW